MTTDNALPELVIPVPLANERYFHELIAGGIWVVGASAVALGMLYMIMFYGEVLALRFFFFFIIGISIIVLMLGIKIIMASETERGLARKVKDREWVMTDEGVTLCISLAEGPLRVRMRNEQLPSTLFPWDTIRRVIMDAKAPPPATIDFIVAGHELLGEAESHLPVQKRYFGADEEAVLAYFTAKNIKIERKG